MNRPIFVYGILKRRPDAKPAIVPGFRMVDMGHFPAAIPGEEDDALIGELIFVDDDTVEHFDMIEGYPNFYDRQGVKVVTEEDETIEAEMYVVTEPYWKDSIPGDRLLVKTEAKFTTYEYNLDG